jgi:PHD/YefM family antitoxin component YafN of YafNO toxin-antitoxin module
MSIKTKNIISITEARSSIFDIAEKIQKQGNHYIFTENGKAKMAVMSAVEYDSLMEDLVLMADPKFMAKMKKLSTGYVEGEYVPWEEVKRKLDLKHHNLVLADKSKKKYLIKKDSRKHNK